MKEPDTQHKLLLAEGTLKHIEWVLTSDHEIINKLRAISNAIEKYHEHKKKIETKGYL